MQDRKGLTIAIDFDGTIVEHAYPRIGAIKEYAIETMKALKTEGHRIIIWSCRWGRKEEEMIEFLEKNGIPYDTINEPTDTDLEVDEGFYECRKVYADLYIDDKGVFPATRWDLIAKALGVWNTMVKNMVKVESI